MGRLLFVVYDAALPATEQRGTVMEGENSFQEMGQELGYGGVERLVNQVEEVCVNERRRIELTNESKILGLQAELAIQAEEERRISERLRLAPPSGDRRSRRLKAWLAGGTALLLTVAGFFFSLLSFDPFRLGWKSYLYCIGVAIVSPFTIEKALEEWDCRNLIRGVATVACVAAITSLVSLAVIRGDLFAQELKGSETPVLLESNGPAPPQNGNRFYEEALPVLQVGMALLAVAMELGAGLAFQDAKRLALDSGEDSEKLAKELVAVRQGMAGLASEATELSNEGQVFESRFWRDFHRAMLTHAARRALGKLLVLGLCVLLFGAGRLHAAEQPLNLVVLIDLSASVATKGPDGKTNFQKNVSAVSELLARVPAGSKVAILGITDKSFAEPDILLSAEVSQDPGYFGERLAAARRQLIKAWNERAAQLTPDAQQTDICGALLVVGQFFRGTPNDTRRVLIMYSDMRQATPALNLEESNPIAADSILQKVRAARLLAKLKEVEVFVLGADAANKQAAQWESLRRFWMAYFKDAGANVQNYSILRVPPGL